MAKIQDGKSTLEWDEPEPDGIWEMFVVLFCSRDLVTCLYLVDHLLSKRHSKDMNSFSGKQGLGLCAHNVHNDLSSFNLISYTV